MDASAAAQRHADNMAVFQALSGSLEEEAALRERIRDSVREFDSNVRSLTAQSVALSLLWLRLLMPVCERTTPQLE